MAYDVHVFRGKNWWEGSSDPITPEELLKIEGVQKSDSASSTNPQSGVTVKVSSNDMFAYNGGLTWAFLSSPITSFAKSL